MHDARETGTITEWILETGKLSGKEEERSRFGWRRDASKTDDDDDDDDDDYGDGTIEMDQFYGKKPNQKQKVPPVIVIHSIFSLLIYIISSLIVG